MSQFTKKCVVIITQGGAVAAPIASYVLGEVLPYIEAQKNDEAEQQNQTVQTPDIRNMTIDEAEETLKQSGLDIQLDVPEDVEIDKKQSIVIEQLPKPGIMVKQGTKIIISI